MEGAKIEPPKLKNVIRLDSLPITQTIFTEEGYLIDRPILTTTGIFEYSNPDGSTRRELRLPDEVFDKESLESYKGKPIIVTHDAGLIDKNNVCKEQIGTILSDGYKSGDDVRAEIVIHDTDVMRKSGLRELSLGYNLDLDETPGVWNGQKYDAVQKNIRINHLALVREARAGDNARLNIDSRDGETKFLKGKKVEKIMAKNKKTKFDGILSQEELKKAIEEYKAKRAKGKNEDEDDEELVEEVAEDSHYADVPSAAKREIEGVVKMCRQNRDERDEYGDPVDMDDAMEMIAGQDEDIQRLFDIIDTLLAEREFSEDGCKKDADDEEDVNLEDFEEDEDEPEDGEEEEIDLEDIEENEDEDEPEDGDDEEIDLEDIEENEDEDEPEDDEEDFEEEDFEEDEDDDEDFFSEKKKHCKGKCKGMNADSVDKIVRTRVNIGMVGRALNMDGLENMNVRDAKKAIIKRVRPNIRLDGRSDAYVNMAYDLACEEVKHFNKKGVLYQKRQMFNKKGSRMDGSSEKSGAFAARERMIKKMKKNGGKD